MWHTYLPLVNVNPMKGKCSPEKTGFAVGGAESCTKEILTK